MELEADGMTVESAVSTEAPLPGVDDDDPARWCGWVGAGSWLVCVS